jgi:hypothetical protein
VKIKIKKNGVKIKIKINSYELYKLQLKPEQLTRIIESASGIKDEICDYTK